ncbi:winged helix-turn-helix domain-containing protein [Halomarina ordinaria]|uniref:Winged helix-turn-helix domain-containing protein n=1 Tax=Halomarina ordinaria TaxID=3033939 RepID=A0ABD5UDV7_9EURY|nr:winged helix-turn-helix domain-containing protein [Halomarina sp. PSRA2]
MSGTPGRPPTVSDEEILEVFRSASDPVLTTADLAGEFSLTRRGMLDRLKKLERAGVLHSKAVGARGVVWWLPGHTNTTSDR